MSPSPCSSPFVAASRLLVDHRFDRARYDGERTAAAFAERLREQVDLAGLEADIAGVVDGALRPDERRRLDPPAGSSRRGMTRRAVAVTAWLAIAAMNALWVWAVVGGGFLDAMFASLAIEEQRMLTPGMLAVTYAAMTGILVVTIAYATVGLLLALRPGGGRMGAILLVGSAVFAAVPFGYAFAGTMAIRNPLDPVANVLVLLGPALVPIGYALILPVIALTFPDGRLPSTRWRWPARLALVPWRPPRSSSSFTPGKIQNIVPWNPIGIDALPVWIWSLAWPLQGLGAVLISVLGVAGVVTRYRRSAGVERQQLRWFVAAVALAVVPITISPLGGGPGDIPLGGVGLLLVPASVWIAVTRYHLYEIDRLISRTIGWALVTGVLGAVFVVTVVGSRRSSTR